MKKNLYYRNVLQRRTATVSFFEALPAWFGSTARLMLEVFIRKNFGERYFRFHSIVYISVFMAIIPFFEKWSYKLLSSLDRSGFIDIDRPDRDASIWPHYIAWYVYIAGFLYMGFKHRRDLKRNPSTFDFARYSLYAGDKNPLFFKVNLPGGRKADTRLVECFIEPAFFFLIGVILVLLQQRLGAVMLFCSISYAVSYVVDYRFGDHYILDKIDEMISNKNLAKALTSDSPEDSTSGFQFIGRRPATMEGRKQLLAILTEDDAVEVS